MHEGIDQARIYKQVPESSSLYACNNFPRVAEQNSTDKKDATTHAEA